MEGMKKALQYSFELQGFFVLGELWIYLKNQLLVALIKAYDQNDKQYEVNDEPHHEFAFFTFIFDMIRHNYIF